MYEKLTSSLASGEVDVLASLLDVHPFTTVVAGRIDLTAPWRVDTSPTDLLVVHVQIVGRSYVAHSAGEECSLEPGDVAIFPHGGGGFVHDGSRPARATTTLSVPMHGLSTTLAPMKFTGASVDNSFVSCLIQIGDVPRGPLWDSLPHLIRVSTRTDEHPGQLSRVVELFTAEASEPGPGSARLLSRLADILLILALRRQANDDTSRPGLRALADPVVAPALMTIHADPSGPLSVGSLATTCGLSRSAFAAHFTKAVGETPVAYVIRWRMAVAARKLATSDLTIDRVAAGVGYRSEAAFRRAFSTALGCSPREYRNRQIELLNTDTV